MTSSARRAGERTNDISKIEADVWREQLTAVELGMAGTSGTVVEGCVGGGSVEVVPGETVEVDVVLGSVV